MIFIEPFRSNYSAGVVDVILPIQRTEFEIPITVEQQPDLQNIPAFYRHGCGNFWVALDGPQVVGTIALLDIGNGQAALRKMFVKSAYRGREHGVAKKLLDVLLDWSLMKDVKEILLGTTAKFLAAHRFYEKNDFCEISRAELPASFPVMIVDTKFYRRILR